MVKTWFRAALLPYLSLLKQLDRPVKLSGGGTINTGLAKYYWVDLSANATLTFTSTCKFAYITLTVKQANATANTLTFAGSADLTGEVNFQPNVGLNALTVYQFARDTSNESVTAKYKLIAMR